MAKNSGEIRCSFCNKTQDQVKKLIAGPAGVYICDECVDICADIIEEEFEDEPVAAKGQEINLLKPVVRKRLKRFLLYQFTTITREYLLQKVMIRVK